MKTFQPADHLHSRTFIGMLIAQFFAAFNDQAIHAAAMFYAINTEVMNEAQAITLMPLLFYLPWAIFPTLAGYFADRYSKRYALVIWKVVEVAICLLALYGFWLGRNGDQITGTWIVLACVFGMGMHSAFFVPAKYGVMPEILTPRMLSRGNGILESLSFLAIITGTVFGGVLSTQFRGQEYLIGLILVGLAVIGAVASLLIETMPAANPTRPFPPYVYQPLWNNVRMLLTNRPLVFAVVGIAFFTFLVAYMRQVVYMHGQSQLPRWSEAYTSYIVGVVALGIGIGSPLVGYLSGGKVEIGLVTVGAVGMMLATTAAALTLFQVPLLVVAIAFIGFFTGFYLVPLYSLLQHRAPKSAKGDAVATSNFLNITGAIAASVIFGSLTALAQTTGFTPRLAEAAAPHTGVLTELRYDHGHPVVAVVGGKTITANEEGPDHFVFLAVSPNVKKPEVESGQRVVVRTYANRQMSEEGKVLVTRVRIQPEDEAEQPFFNQARLPALLFLGAGGLTLVILLVLVWVLPDLFRRTRIWSSLFVKGVKLETAGLLRLPGNGPALLVTNAAGVDARAQVESGVDRVTHFVDAGPDPEAAIRRGKQLLARREVVAVSVDGNEGLLRELMADAPVLPVCHHDFEKGGARHAYVVAGSLLAAGSPPDQATAELARLKEQLTRQVVSGGPLAREEEH